MAEQELFSQLISMLFAQYGPIAIPVVFLGLIIKYLLDKDKQRELNHKVEIAAERANVVSERARADGFMNELLEEARSNGLLADELKKALETIARRAV